ncbi:hypothetical protein Ancab_037323 [Ancistrocladus abbreviatus]
MAEAENLVHDVRHTSVVPGRIAGEDRAHELTAMDLAMRFHYIRALYFFAGAAVQGIQPHDFKKPMFLWLIPYFKVCGRIRISETGRPFIKLNDAGVRIIEARASKTIDEWLAMKDVYSLEDKLTCSDAHGHEPGFIPLVFIQITWFKCGGISMGLTWAHVLGDVFSASAFLNGLTQFFQDQHPPKPLQMPDLPEAQCSRSIAAKAHSLKRVDPDGNIWIAAADCKMAKHTFHVTSKQLEDINSSIMEVPDPEVRSFELISAIIWKCMATIRQKFTNSNIVTICKNKSKSKDRENEIPYNGLKVGTVEVKFSIIEVDIVKLATAIVEEMEEENGKIEEMVEEELFEVGKSDYIVYGAKLTFLDMEGANIYSLKMKGQDPIFVNYSIVGVGNEGVVLVFSRPPFGKECDDTDRLVTAILPENELEELKNMLKLEWHIV